MTQLSSNLELRFNSMFLGTGLRCLVPCVCVRDYFSFLASLENASCCPCGVWSRGIVFACGLLGREVESGQGIVCRVVVVK
jgi:hypothetical protein